MTRVQCGVPQKKLMQNICQKYDGLQCSILNSGRSRISPRRGRQLPGEAPTYDFTKISQKLHEIERIWTSGGEEGVSLAPPLDPCLLKKTMISKGKKGKHVFLLEVKMEVKLH